MKKFIKAGFLLLSVAASAALVHAQVTTLPAITVKQPKPKIEKFHGEAVNTTPVAITVRDPKNTALVRTFRFTPELERKMDGHSIENGDKVTVHFIKGSDTAVKLSAKIHGQSYPMVKR